MKYVYSELYVEDLQKENRELIEENIKLKKRDAYIEALQAIVAKLNTQVILLQIERNKAEMQVKILNDLLNNKDNIVEL